jgi:hypothetical protein
MTITTELHEIMYGVPLRNQTVQILTSDWEFQKVLRLKRISNVINFSIPFLKLPFLLHIVNALSRYINVFYALWFPVPIHFHIRMFTTYRTQVKYFYL